MQLDPLAADRSKAGEKGEHLAGAGLGSLAGHLAFHPRAAQDARLQGFQRRFGCYDLWPGRHCAPVPIERIVGTGRHLALLTALRRLTRALAGDGEGSAT